MKQKWANRLGGVLMAMLLCFGLTACGQTVPGLGGSVDSDAAKSGASAKTEAKTETKTAYVNAGGGDGVLAVSYIDVGQADSIFLKLPDSKTMLIDAGEKKSGKTVVDYIEAQNVERLDYVVGTHPHADHIGGMAEVINRFEVDKLYMPKAQSNSKTFENLLETIQQKGLKVTTAKAGVSIAEGADYTIELLAPVKEKYEDLNNYSAVVKLTYGEHRFLFMGDAEAEVEGEITADVKADVLKVGHHGSKTSTSDAFLKKVAPKYGVIMCGVDNSYNHPSDSTLKTLNKAEVTVLRTDTDGTIVFTSDGKTLKGAKTGK